MGLFLIQLGGLGSMVQSLNRVHHIQTIQGHIIFKSWKSDHICRLGLYDNLLAITLPHLPLPTDKIFSSFCMNLIIGVATGAGHHIWAWTSCGNSAKPFSSFLVGGGGSVRMIKRSLNTNEVYFCSSRPFSTCPLIPKSWLCHWISLPVYVWMGRGAPMFPWWPCGWCYRYLLIFNLQADFLYDYICLAELCDYFFVQADESMSMYLQQEQLGNLSQALTFLNQAIGNSYCIVLVIFRTSSTALCFIIFAYIE